MKRVGGWVEKQIHRQTAQIRGCFFHLKSFLKQKGRAIDNKNLSKDDVVDCAQLRANTVWWRTPPPSNLYLEMVFMQILMQNEIATKIFTKVKQSLAVHWSSIMITWWAITSSILKLSLASTKLYNSFTDFSLWFHSAISLHCALHLLRRRTNARPRAGVVDGPKFHLWRTHGRIVVGLLPHTSQTVPSNDSWSSWGLLLWRLRLVWSQPSPAKNRSHFLPFPRLLR